MVPRMAKCACGARRFAARRSRRTGRSSRPPGAGSARTGRARGRSASRPGGAPVVVARPGRSGCRASGRGGRAARRTRTGGARRAGTGRGVHRPVGAEGQRDHIDGRCTCAVRAGVGAADGAVVDLQPGQVRRVLPPSVDRVRRSACSSRSHGCQGARAGSPWTVPRRPRRCPASTSATCVPPAGARTDSSRANSRCARSRISASASLVGAVSGAGIGSSAQVPAFADLLDAQPPVAFGARLALGRQPGAARHVDDLGLAGDQVGAAHAAIGWMHTPCLLRRHLAARPGTRVGAGGRPGSRPWRSHISGQYVLPIRGRSAGHRRTRVSAGNVS